ncbi:MAG: formate dehydrogenase accessory sulfurtransferase FdhD [Chthonomonadaceae bacterium]|nr:formate dehydrogenase accessory sulfurtransferase FdhD [Chthonomonadaceae bacterium]
MNPGIKRVVIEKVEGNRWSEKTDALAVEEPLEIQIGFVQHGERIHKAVSITMRTPGNDAELALGFLFAEGLLDSSKDVLSVESVGKPDPETGRRNTLSIELADGLIPDFKTLERNFYTTSSCGVCGKSSLDALQILCPALPPDPLMVSSEVIHSLPSTLRAAQAVFDQTGGLHASALFDNEGNLLTLREDVGRHNALDKVIGAEFVAHRIPLSSRILLVSGRVSFELVQKTVRAGIPLLAAVGAPSSLAVETAQRFGLTLLGFVREGKFNLYAGGQRIADG